jgi:hypothetical protein
VFVMRVTFAAPAVAAEHFEQLVDLPFLALPMPPRASATEQRSCQATRRRQRGGPDEGHRFPTCHTGVRDDGPLPMGRLRRGGQRTRRHVCDCGARGLGSHPYPTAIAAEAGGGSGVRCDRFLGAVVVALRLKASVSTDRLGLREENPGHAHDADSAPCRRTCAAVGTSTLDSPPGLPLMAFRRAVRPARALLAQRSVLLIEVSWSYQSTMLGGLVSRAEVQRSTPI